MQTPFNTTDYPFDVPHDMCHMALVQDFLLYKYHTSRIVSVAYLNILYSAYRRHLIGVIMWLLDVHIPLGPDDLNVIDVILWVMPLLHTSYSYVQLVQLLCSTNNMPWLW